MTQTQYSECEACGSASGPFTHHHGILCCFDCKLISEQEDEYEKENTSDGIHHNSRAAE